MPAYTNTKEKGLEALIVKWLVEHNDYEEGHNADYNKEYAIDETRLFRFLQDTQPSQMESLSVFKSEQKKRQFLNRLQGKLRVAFRYALNQERHLRVFLDDGEVSIDNNPSERAIRGFCIGKKSWEMVDTINGAKPSAVIYSIAETAKANKLRPYDYFNYLLTEIAKHMEDTDRAFLDDLLPWSENLPKDIRNTG